MFLTPALAVLRYGVATATPTLSHPSEDYQLLLMSLSSHQLVAGFLTHTYSLFLEDLRVAMESW